MAEEEGIVMVAVGITAVMVMLIMLMAEDITHMLIVVVEDIILMVSMVADMDNNTFSC